MLKKDNWGWFIEIENVKDRTITKVQINNSKGCIYIHSEIQKIIGIFWNIDNKITIYFRGIKDSTEVKTK